MERESLDNVYATSVLIVAASRRSNVSYDGLLHLFGKDNIAYETNGLEALKICTMAPPGLVVVDKDVDFIDGWLFIEELKNSDRIPNIPVIFVGEGACQVSKAKMAEYGVLDYIPTPIHRDTIAPAIERIEAAHSEEEHQEYKYTEAKKALVAQEGEKAVAAYEELDKTLEASFRSGVGLAQAYDQNNQPDAMADVLDRLGKQSSTNLAVLKMRHLQLLKQGQTDAAKDTATRILEMYSDSYYYYAFIGDQYMAAEQWDLLTWLLAKAQEASVAHLDIDLLGAKMAVHHKRFTEALVGIKGTIQRYGNSLQLLNLAGVCHRNLEQYNEALECYEEGLKLSPMNARILFNIALCMIALNDLSGAIAKLEACLKVDPSFAKAAEKLSSLQKEAG